MPFRLNFPVENADVSVRTLQLDIGEALFVLGGNGTGKSSLMFHGSSLVLVGGEHRKLNHRARAGRLPQLSWAGWRCSERVKRGARGGRNRAIPAGSGGRAADATV